MPRLIVLPGLSSPNHPDYKPVYDLLRNEGARRGWSDVHVIEYPGQIDSKGNTPEQFSHAASITKAASVLTHVAESNCPFHVLGLSYGCNILLSVARSRGLRESNGWQRATIWGPFSYWRTWQHFHEPESWSSAMKGTNPSGSPRDFFERIIPNEDLITKVALPVSVGVGSLDKYVTKPELDCLEAYCRQEAVGRRTFAHIEGCGHNVSVKDPGYMDYLDFVFAGKS